VVYGSVVIISGCKSSSLDANTRLGSNFYDLVFFLNGKEATINRALYGSMDPS